MKRALAEIEECWRLQANTRGCATSYAATPLALFARHKAVLLLSRVSISPSTTCQYGEHIANAGPGLDKKV